MATSSSSVGGLVSGLDTKTLITQLMAKEATTQTRLKKQLTTENAATTALQGLNTQTATLASQAKELADPKSWRALTVTSSSTAVAASGSTSGTAVTAGTFSFEVRQTAAAHRLTFAGTAQRTDRVLSGSDTTVSLTIGGATKTLDTKDGTLAGLADALNAPGTGVNAATLRLDDGTYRLVVTAADTGAAQAFTLTKPDGTPLLGGASVTSGRDAQIALGGDLLSSASNTFTDTLPGVRFTVSDAAVGTTVSLTSTRDAGSVRDKVKALVESTNALLTKLDSLTSVGTTATQNAPLAREAAARALRSELLDTVYPAGGGSMADLGIQVTREGRLSFDADSFDKAFAADPVATQAAFTTATTTGGAAGFAARLEKVTKDASSAYTGTLSQAISNRGATVSRLQDSIADWDGRLELRRASLERQYAALETALQKISGQSGWLTSQLGSG